MSAAWLYTRLQWAIVALLVAVAPPAIGGTLPEALHYAVFDGNKRVGDIRISLQTSEQGSEQRLTVRQQGEIVLHRLLLKATIRQSIEEHWEGGRLLALRSETSSESPIGDAHKTLAVERAPSGTLGATVDGSPLEWPADALPLSIWSARTLVPGPHFELAGGALSTLQTSSGGAPEEVVGYQDQPCRSSSFTTANDDKKSVLTAWLGNDEIVCQIRIRSGRDVFTYVRQPLP
jgi:hypothetical protein